METSEFPAIYQGPDLAYAFKPRTEKRNRGGVDRRLHQVYVLKYRNLVLCWCASSCITWSSWMNIFQILGNILKLALASNDYSWIINDECRSYHITFVVLLILYDFIVSVDLAHWILQHHSPNLPSMFAMITCSFGQWTCAFHGCKTMAKLQEFHVVSLEHGWWSYRPYNTWIHAGGLRGLRMNCSADLVKKALQKSTLCVISKGLLKKHHWSKPKTSSRLEPTLWLLRLAYDGKQMAQFKSNKIVSVGILSISEGFGTNWIKLTFLCLQIGDWYTKRVGSLWMFTPRSTKRNYCTSFASRHYHCWFVHLAIPLKSELLKDAVSPSWKNQNYVPTIYIKHCSSVYVNGYIRPNFFRIFVTSPTEHRRKDIHLRVGSCGVD